MAISATERRLLEELAADPSNGFSAADAEALALGGLPIWCLLRAGARFVACGIHNDECRAAFLEDVVRCFEG